MSEEELIKETMMLDYSQLVMNNVYCHKEIERLKSNEKTLADLLDKEQKKNKKAIEYIEKEMFMYDNIESEREDLLNILKGDDKE